MTKGKSVRGAKQSPVQVVEQRARSVADAMGLELVEVTLQKESRGKCLCVYVDKEGGLTLNDCEKYHRQLQPMLEDIDYDIMEVSSPGVDRPIKTLRDFEKKRGNMVEVRLFAARDGVKLFRGALTAMDDATVTITDAADQPVSFERRDVALIKPVIELDEEDLTDVVFDEEE